MLSSLAVDNNRGCNVTYILDDGAVAKAAALFVMLGGKEK